MYILDANICIYALKNHSDNLRHKFKSIKNISNSSVTYAELCYGIENGDKSMKEFSRVPKLSIENWVVEENYL